MAEVIPELEANYKPRTRFVTPWEMVALCCQLEAQDEGLVYGRLPSADLGRLLREGTAPRGELLVSCERVQDGGLEATVRNGNMPDPAVIAVRRDGIEPPTRGFSIDPAPAKAPRKMGFVAELG